MRTSKEDIVNLRSLVGGKIINIYGTEYDSGYFEMAMLFRIRWNVIRRTV